MTRGMMTALVFVLSTSPLAAQGRDANAAKYGWLSSLQAGKAQARETGKPLMVVLRCVP